MLPDQEDIDEALPENEALPEDKYDRGEIEDEDEIPNEVYHTITLTPSTQELYGMDRLIKNRNQDYIYRFASVMHHEMIQVSLKRGLKQFKERGKKAVSKELLQLHTNITFRTLKAGDLTDREKYKALESLMLLKDKRDGSVKGQACSNIQKQRPG